MKNKACVVLKQIMTVVGSIAKAKSVAIKSKMSAVKARFIMMSLMKNKKVLMGTITEKIHTILGHIDKDEDEDEEEEEESKGINVVCSNAWAEQEEDDDKYPDLTHSLFDEEEEYLNDQAEGSIIDLVKNSKEDFRLEDEIDHVADLFIMRFHKQMRLQKLHSFKRFQEMLARSV